MATNINMKDWYLKSEEFNDSEVGNNDYEGDTPLRSEFMEGTVIKWKGIISSNDDYHNFAKKHYIAVKSLIEADKEAQYEEGTLLHTLIHQLKRTLHWPLWTKFILDVAKVVSIQILLVNSRNEERSCIQEAIIRTEIDFIRFVASLSDRKDMREAIAAINLRKQNCVHLAIFKLDSNHPRRLEIVDYLVQEADPETLKKQRGRMKDDDKSEDNTCLHDLVDISRCKISNKTSPQASEDYSSLYLKVLRTMATRCPDALKTMNSSKQSPFLYHLDTRSNDKTTKAWTQLELFPTDGNAIETPQRVDRAVGGAIDKNKEPSERGKEGKGSSFQPTAKDELSQVLATKVSKELMELCLSQSSFSDVCDSLFGYEYPRSELMFKVTSLTDKTTKKHEALKLNHILACVEVNLCGATSSSPDGHLAQDIARDPAGEAARRKREHLIADLFNWLRKRNVKRIIKLVVSDHPSLPCRDSIIMEALRGFDVRYLDWDKEDLDVQYLAENTVSPNLRELWLSWSGRNSTLHGWSNREHGLWKLHELKTVYVSTNQHWEEGDTNEKNFSNFKSAMSNPTDNPLQCTGCSKRNTRPIFVDSTDDGDSTLSYGEHQRRVTPRTNHKWLEAVRSFQRALNDFVSKDQREKMKGKVKVAIIDDGVDLEALETVEYIPDGWYPDRKAPDRRGMNVWYSSDEGHGTEMARLVHTVCPFVTLYVAKLDTKKLVYKSIAESAAKAVEASVKHGANVISMSWTMYVEKDNQDGIRELNMAINDAGKDTMDKDGDLRHTMMFCASEDCGYLGSRPPYPAANCNTKIIKRVGAAGNYGERTDYVNQESIDYLFPGEVVSQRKEPVHGSSVSTALASGLAALILYCAELQKEESSLAKSMVETSPHTGGQLKRKGSIYTNGGNAAGVAPPAAKSPACNFQTHTEMYGLFDALKSSKENPLVNITGILAEAAKDPNPPRRLIEMCQKKI